MYRLHEKIIYRKLYIHSPTSNISTREDVDNIVMDFVRQSIGNPFRLQYSKILFSSDDPHECDPSKKVEKGRGFFCSELVAMLYKKLGLLSD
jgi:hypothetical protein